MPEKRVDSPRFSRMPEALMRSIRRRSLRVKRTKSLVLVNEKRKSGLMADGVRRFSNGVRGPGDELSVGLQQDGATT
ncbi:hypothetical protein MSG28_002632 [Choristoneura fumiferana]|uniref:Uncharacterized protein n=1 Tax=Choristoneura fumiferana TaxID=7141 RepID=A0ACC0JIL3_CHOFU|nr:hypothetical protein MSG28_002632 [Choristoneura fumiferana]